MEYRGVFVAGIRWHCAFNLALIVCFVQLYAWKRPKD